MQYAADRLIFSPSDLVVYMDGDFASWMERWYAECRNGNKSVSNELGLPHGVMLGGVACMPDEQDAELKLIAAKGTMILDELLDRIYLMRCQLVHGAATYGGKLNRTSLRHCVCMLQHLLADFLLVWVEGGADQDWGPMCYPPLKSTSAAEVHGNRPKTAK